MEARRRMGTVARRTLIALSDEDEKALEAIRRRHWGLTGRTPSCSKVVGMALQAYAMREDD